MDSGRLCCCRRDGRYPTVLLSHVPGCFGRVVIMWSAHLLKLWIDDTIKSLGHAILHTQRHRLSLISYTPVHDLDVVASGQLACDKQHTALTAHCHDQHYLEGNGNKGFACSYALHEGSLKPLQAAVNLAFSPAHSGHSPACSLAFCFLRPWPTARPARATR